MASLFRLFNLQLPDGTSMNLLFQEKVDMGKILSLWWSYLEGTIVEGVEVVVLPPCKVFLVKLFGQALSPLNR